MIIIVKMQQDLNQEMVWYVRENVLFFNAALSGVYFEVIIKFHSKDAFY